MPDCSLFASGGSAITPERFLQVRLARTFRAVRLSVPDATPPIPARHGLHIRLQALAGEEGIEPSNIRVKAGCVHLFAIPPYRRDTLPAGVVSPHYTVNEFVDSFVLMP